MAQFVAENNGYGLAAPQIGIPQRFCVINHGKGFKVYCNPVIEWWSEEVNTKPEWCYSVPGKGYDVERYNEVVVRYKDLQGKNGLTRLEGMEARVIQHEVDHLNGILISKCGKEHNDVHV